MNKEEMMKAGSIPEELMQQAAMQAPQEQMPANNNVSQNLMQQVSSNAEYQQNGINGQINNTNTQQPGQISQMSPDMIKQVAARDIQNIQNMIRSGSINPIQGQNLMSYVTKKAFEMVNNQHQKNGLSGQMSQPCPQQNANTAELVLENPEFFNLDGRSDVLSYLKEANAAVDKDEISKISGMIEKIENTAVERYLRKQEHEKTLNDENETAKLRLRANAQNSINAENKNMVFTREQIGKMSGAEFAKNERVIMDQLKKGLIR